MHPLLASAGEARATPIWFMHAGNADEVLKGFGERERNFANAAGFEPKPGKLLLLPSLDGKLAGVLFGLEKPGDPIDPFRPGQLSSLLPAGVYRFNNAPHDARLAALAFITHAYQFTRYRKADARNVRLVVPAGVDGEDVSRIAEGVALARDLINTPSNDMGPDELEAAARALAKQHSARVAVTGGEALEKDFPLIHAVGMGSPRSPRLIDITWGDERDPKITLVGKGVCFDTGGLDIKPSSGMLNMKKDMGGAATVARPRAYDHGAAAESAAARADPGGGEFDFRRELPPARRVQIAQRHHGRDRQYRRRRPAGAGRCAGIGRRREAGVDRRFRHAHRRGARRARH